MYSSMWINSAQPDAADYFSVEICDIYLTVSTLGEAAGLCLHRICQRFPATASGH